MKTLLKLIVKIVALAAVTVVIAFAISHFREKRIINVLDTAGVVLLAIGASAVFGGQKIFSNPGYNLTKSIIGPSDPTRRDVELILEGYAFCLTTGIAGALVLLTSVLVWKFF